MEEQTVFILEGHVDYESDHILGVFVSRELAQETLDKESAKDYPRWGSSYDSYTIGKYEVEVLQEISETTKQAIEEIIYEAYRAGESGGPIFNAKILQEGVHTKVVLDNRDHGRTTARKGADMVVSLLGVLEGKE